MATRAVQQIVRFWAWDTFLGAGKAGDSANFTLRWVKDGVASALTNGTITEVSAGTLPGLHSIVITVAESDCNSGEIAGTSSTTDIVIVGEPREFERLPNAAPGAVGGLPLGSADGAIVDWAAITNPTVTKNLSATTVAAVTNAVGSVTGNVGGNVAGSVASVTNAVKIQSGITKNAALANFKFLMISSADHISGKAGLTITAERSIDEGAFAACANAATELSGGAYEIDFAQTDLNGDVVMFKFTAPGADPRFITIRTTP